MGLLVNSENLFCVQARAVILVRSGCIFHTEQSSLIPALNENLNLNCGTTIGASIKWKHKGDV